MVRRKRRLEARKKIKEEAKRKKKILTVNQKKVIRRANSLWACKEVIEFYKELDRVKE